MWRILVVFVLVCGGSGRVWAQAGATAQVLGVVRDSRGAVIVGASVVARNVEVGTTLSVVSGEMGEYVFPGLAPGRWEIRVEHPGFKPLVRQVELKVGQKIALDLVLAVGEVTEVVEVRGEVPLVEATRVDQSQVIEQRFVTDLPISGRRFIDFALLTPNVSIGRSYVGTSSAPQQETQALKISFGGLRELYANNVRIDGAEATVSYTGVSRLTPSQEAVLEFRVLQGGYAPEYGRASGGIVNIVTKGGTNEVHGSLFYFLRNDALDARNPLRVAGGDMLRQHQFGWTVGGPIRRDRLFYFGSYEGQRRTESPLYSQFITTFLQEINRVKSLLGLSPEDLNAPRRENDADQFLVRGDYTRGRTILFGRYDFNEQRNKNQPATIEGQGLPSNFRHNEIRDQSGVVGITSVLSSSLTNEGLLNIVSRTFENPSVSFEPGIQIINTADMGRHAGPYDFYRERRVQIADVVSYTRGRHLAKFGVDINHVRNRVVFSGFNPAIALFTVESFFGLPPFSRPTAVLFLFSVPRERQGGPLPQRDFSRLFPDPEWEAAATLSPTHTFFEAFGQDQVRLGRVTVTFGVRYGFETRPYGIVAEDRNNIQPRLGFAYALTPRTVLRGGGGIYMGPMAWSEVLGYLTPWGGRDFPDPRLRLTPIPFRLGAVGPPPGPFTAGRAFETFLRTGMYPSAGLSRWILIKPEWELPNPYAEHGLLQIERELARDWGVTVGYLFVHGLKMSALRHVNAQPAGFLPNGKRRYMLRDPQFGFYQVLGPTQTSVYHAGNLVVQKRMSHHVGFVANYTFSKTIDNMSPSVSLIQIPEDPLNARLDRAVSQMHVGHRFVMSGIVEGPARFFVTRGMKLGVILTLESPRFYTLYAGFDANGDGQPSNDRVGLLGRNTLEGDGYASVDLRVSREVGLTERVKVEFLGEVFNLFNTLNILDFDTVYGRADFPPGTPVPRRYTERIPSPNPGFLTPRSIGNTRQIQFALRLRF